MSYQLQNITVLIVDDMKPMLALTKSVLTSFGIMNVLQAENVQEAFELLCRFDPDFVITDWLMEPEDGLDLVKKIRTDERAPNPFVPIIMMTGFSSRIRVESARDVGITEFLVKPFTAQDLYARVQQIIEKPRQFVDTGEFFGPDRRRKKGEDYTGPRRRDVDELKKSDVTGEAKNILKQLSDEAKNI